jgi:DNA-binding transcriptional LysR family regulator
MHGIALVDGSRYPAESTFDLPVLPCYKRPRLRKERRTPPKGSSFGSATPVLLQQDRQYGTCVPGLVGNECVVSETFAQTGKGLLCGLCLFEVKAALLLGSCCIGPACGFINVVEQREEPMQQSKIRRYLKHGMLPQLCVFEAVTRLGSFTRAAEELYLAQPTVSVQMKKLTETVGLPLFEQVGKRVHATAVGRELYAACREIFSSLSEVECTLSDLRGLKSGVLHVATSTAGKYFVPRVLAEFVKAHPGIDVSLHISCRQTLLERLAANVDDLLVLVNVPADTDIVVQRILPNPLQAFARADHPLAKETNIPFARFAQEPFLIREPGSGTRRAVEQVFARHGISPQIRMELGDNEAIKETILSGLGVSILLRDSLGFDTGPGHLAALDVEGFPLESHWHFVYPVGKRLSFVAQSFMDFARKEAKRVIDANHHGA